MSTSQSSGHSTSLRTILLLITLAITGALAGVVERQAGCKHKQSPGAHASCRARVNARVDCQPTAHTGNTPCYKLQQSNYVDVWRYAAGEKVRHNDQINGEWALVDPDPIFDAAKTECWIPVLYLGRCYS
ncbi:uncharacterized protein F5Z01DRAFT_243411 [Emericellopsis atlantica]|uniref:Secreted protein n=1 Tax=Emericellopsis atlantica TaxID=2614577 RepID=A0A9P7ZIR3_9HYPO|nr:uncharacterized protein F5Z01DRAFT_243411 [Emericellopsis atlantica]KAG9252350.1 hypothetical protein F5Z01DRAFT_243411 [Emericellopsis atlantica]